MWPHPVSDPQGHRYGHAPAPNQAFDPVRWQHHELFCEAIDLFNHGFYWEAHEAWEHCWHQAGRQGAVADFCKGLIKLSAAGVKAREGVPAGVARHGARAAELFDSVVRQAGVTRLAGFDLEELADRGRRAPELLLAEPAQRAPVKVVFSFALVPVD